jgi:biopolymer transport protein ExbD
LALHDGIPSETFVIDRIHVDREGALRWNGVPANRATLRKYLSAIATVQPRAFVILDPDPRADCRSVEAVREDMDRSGYCSPGLCGEGHGAWGESAPR